jgi:hypothetical protein
VTRLSQRTYFCPQGFNRLTPITYTTKKSDQILGVWLFHVMRLDSAKDAQAVFHYVELFSPMNLLALLFSRYSKATTEIKHTYFEKISRGDFM